MTWISNRRGFAWAGLLLAGASAGAAAQLLELVAAARPVGVGSALAAAALAALLGATAQAGLAILFRLTTRRSWKLEAPDALRRWSTGAAIAVHVALVGAGVGLHVGVGVRGGALGLGIAFAVWCTLGALSGWRLATLHAPGRGSAGRPGRYVAQSAFVLLVILLVAAGVGLGRGAGPDPGPQDARHRRPSVPNQPPPGSVVLIVLDTTRADVFGAYGSQRRETPVFDRLAGEGELFEELISAAPWTVPSHATFFTGLPPRDHDCWFGGRRWLEDDLKTVAESFQERGYETAAFYSNEHLALANLLQGFDVRNSLEAPATGLALGWLMRFTGIGFPEWIDRGSSRAVDEVGAWIASRRQDRPFFLFVNLFEAHEPFVSPLAHHRPPPEVSELESFFTLRGYRERVWHSLGRDQGRAEDIVRAAYRGSIRYQDLMLGRLLEVIGRQYAIDRLPIVVTSDHGENLGEGGRWGHQFALNDKLLHLPFVVRAPGRVTAGSRVKGSFSSVDLPATLLDLAGAGSNFGLGRSLLGGRAPDEATFAEDYPFYVTLNRLERDFASGLGDFRWPMSSVRAEGHKLVIWHGGPTRLFDLSADPAEATDVLASRPEIAERLLTRLADWSSGIPRRHRAVGSALEPATLVDPELAERLRALGYL